MFEEKMSEKTPLLVTANGDIKQHKPQNSAHERYKSSVTHLPDPRFILFGGIGNPTAYQPKLFDDEDTENYDNNDDNDMKEAQIENRNVSNIVLSKYDGKKEMFFTWISVFIFGLSLIVAVICVVLGISSLNDITLVSIVFLFGCSILGLLLAYYYRNEILKASNLNKHLIHSIYDNQKAQYVSNEKEHSNPLPNISLLESFRRGYFYKNLKTCSSKELKGLLPVVAHTLCLLPFGLTNFRSDLFIILANRISKDPSLDQAFRFFLNSYGDVPEIRHCYSDHEYLRVNNNKYKKYEKKENEKSNKTNAVSFWYNLFNQLKHQGSRTEVDSKDYVCDPINGNILISVQLRQIMASNAKPYLLDLYTFDSTTQSALLSSKMLLKKGDDLRKDLGVLLMFEFFNLLWRESKIKFESVICQTLTYQVIPMAIDFGVIEFIENARKISEIGEMMKSAENESEVMSKLVSSAAASYVASYAVGVRDRHNDNILVCDDGSLFNIDFAYILGEKVSGLDASKISIPPKFVKVLGKKNWNKFLDLSVECYQCLRSNYIQILDYMNVVFAFMGKKQLTENERYLMDALQINVSADEEKDVSDKIRSLFQRAPKQIKSKMKNIIHNIAVKKISVDK